MSDMTKELYTGGISQVKAYRILQAAVANVVKSYELGSVSEWFVLSHVYYNDNVMAKDLAALLQVEAPLITRLVGNLERKGLVTITVHPDDKRVKFIKATDEAASLVATIQSRIQAAVDALLAGLTQQDLDSYQRVLTAIIKNGEKI
jgi:DNA-binding MarR family transcriptional regulator